MAKGNPKKELEITQRRQRVGQMITAGIGYREIAAREGVSIGTVASDKREIFREWQRHYAGDWSEGMLIDLRRVDMLIQRCAVRLNQIDLRRVSGDLGEDSEPHQPTSDPGNELETIRTYLKCLERRAKIIGYDAKDRRYVPIKFPDLDPAIDVPGQLVDGDGNRVTDKSPAARIYAILGGRRQGHQPHPEPPLPEIE